MKRVLIAAVALLAAGCQASDASGTGTPASAGASVSSVTRSAVAESASPTPSVNAKAQRACQSESDLAESIHGRLTMTQLGTADGLRLAMTVSGDGTLAAFVANTSAASIDAILEECVTLGYLDAAPVVDTAPPVAPTASAGDVQLFTRGGATAGVIQPSASKAFASLGYLTPTRGHFVALVVSAQATGSQTFSINPFDFYVRTADGAHYNSTFTSEITPPELDAVTLNPGENTSGSLVFDIPVTSGFQLVYAPLGQAIGIWQY